MGGQLLRWAGGNWFTCIHMHVQPSKDWKSSLSADREGCDVTLCPRRNNTTSASHTIFLITLYLTMMKIVSCSFNPLLSWSMIGSFFPLWSQTQRYFAPRTPVWIPDSGEPQMEFSLPSQKLLPARRPLEDSALLCSPIKQSQVPLDYTTSPRSTLEDMCSPHFSLFF